MEIGKIVGASILGENRNGDPGMNKRLASELLATLEHTANDLDALASKGQVNPETIKEVVSNIDSFSDKLEIAAFGKESFEKRKAKVIRQDSDEPYMKTFDNPQKPIQTESDEPYMHDTGPTWSGKGVKTFDSDDTSQVIDRPETQVRDLSEHSDKTKQQPSWAGGSAGKSTRQGSTKTWAS
jgi:hypothetical protein